MHQKERMANLPRMVIDHRAFYRISVRFRYPNFRLCVLFYVFAFAMGLPICVLLSSFYAFCVCVDGFQIASALLLFTFVCDLGFLKSPAPFGGFVLILASLLVLVCSGIGQLAPNATARASTRSYKNHHRR